MRIKIALLFEDEISQGLVKQAEQTLTGLAVAFGHTFILKEEKIAKASQIEYGMELTEETICSCRQSDLVLACVQSEAAINVLAYELGCFARIRSFSMPNVLRTLSILRTERALVGTLAQALTIEPDRIRALAEFAMDCSRADCTKLTHVPPSGSSRDSWIMAVNQFKARDSDFVLMEASDAVPFIIRSSENFGFLMAAPYPGSIILSAVTALFGVPGILFDEFIGFENHLYAHLVSYNPLVIDDANPIGIHRAVAAFLRSRFGMSKEADCIDAAIHNVLEAGWRTSDMSMIGFPRISMTAMGKLISEQVDMAGNFLNR